jgi:hypothetical protein
MLKKNKNMQKYLVSAVLFGLLLLSGCKTSSKDALSDPVVAIDDNVLTKRELQDAIPDNMSKADSVIFAQDFINRWVKAQLVLRKAEQNLTPEELNVDKLIEEYRTSLLTYQYTQKLLEQKYAPIITTSEIDAYYSKMRDNFKLNEPIIKGVFIKISKASPNIEDVSQLARSERPADLVKLQSYCYQNAKRFEVFVDNWELLSKYSTEFPVQLADASGYFRSQSYYESQDLEFKYILAVRDIRFENEPAPVEYAKNKIKSILLNKKRLEFIKKLEDDLYEDGIKQKVVKFY